MTYAGTTAIGKCTHVRPSRAGPTVNRLPAGSWDKARYGEAKQRMSIDAFYAPADASRLSRTLRRLAKFDLSRWALTGGTAIELQLRERGAPVMVRNLHDLDFIASGFDCLPPALGDLLLPRHVHPHDPPGKTMLQAVDSETAVRVDVFRAYGSEMERARALQLSELPECALSIVAFEDLLARHARLCCALLRGERVAPKYARDFLRMLDLAEGEYIDEVWQDHRKPTDPLSFAEAAGLLREAIAQRAELLIAPVYSTDIDEVCPRCESTASFQLANAGQVLALLGYC